MVKSTENLFDQIEAKGLIIEEFGSKINYLVINNEMNRIQ